MRISDLYHVVFSKQLNNEHEPRIEELKLSKDHWKMRGFLRTIGASVLEEKIYGNSSDILKDHELPSISTLAWQEEFNRHNSKMFISPSNSDVIEVFKQIYLIIYLSEIIQDKYFTFSEHLVQLAWKMMIYFGCDDASQVFNRFDAYVEQNKLIPWKVGKVIDHDFYRHQGFKDISAWQKILEKTKSRRVFDLFLLAHEIETMLERAPKTEEEILETTLKLPSSNVWTREQLITMLELCKDEKTQLEFISAISVENLKSISDNLTHFWATLNKINTKNQQIVLEKLGTEYIRKILEFESERRYFNISYTIEVLHSSTINYFIENIVGTEYFLSQYSDSFQLKWLLQSLPKDYNVLEIITLFSPKQKDILFDNPYAVSELIKFIIPENHLDFLLNTVGILRCQQLTKSAYNLSDILSLLPTKNCRMTFIKEVVPKEMLLKLIKERYFSDVKEKLGGKQEVEELYRHVYPEPELKARETLKKIKKEIVNKKWSFGMNDKVISTYLGKHCFDAPDSVMKQVDVFWSLRKQEINHSSALEKVKEIGQQEAKNNKNMRMSIYHYFMGKNSTEEYFEKYLDEERFNNAFGSIKKN